MDALDTTALVETPERVRFRYRVAGPGRRFGAWFIDFLLRLIVTVLVVVLLGIFTAITYDFFGTSVMGLMLVLMLILMLMIF